MCLRVVIGWTNVVQRRTVEGSFNDLYGRIVADLDARVGRVGGQRDMRETDRAGVLDLCRTDDLEYRNHGVRHVGRDGAEAHVDVEEGRRVADVPARLE